MTGRYDVGRERGGIPPYPLCDVIFYVMDNVTHDYITKQNHPTFIQLNDMAVQAHSTCCRGKVRRPDDYENAVDLVISADPTKWTVFSRHQFTPKHPKSDILDLLEYEQQTDEAPEVHNTVPEEDKEDEVNYDRPYFMTVQMHCKRMRLSSPRIAIPSRAILQDMVGNHTADHFEALQLLVLKRIGQFLPHFIVRFIFDLLEGELKREKMTYAEGIFEQIHHALQPCSVCGKLLAIDVEEGTGEIRSSGKNTTNMKISPVILIETRGV